MRIRPALFGVFVVLAFLAPVVVANASGAWALTGRPAAGDGAGGEGGSGGGQGDGDGVGNAGGENGAGAGDGNGGGPGSGAVAPGDARGWMTLAQVSQANAIPVAEIIAAFDLPAATDPATALRDLESATFSVAALRAWLAERGAP